MSDETDAQAETIEKGARKGRFLALIETHNLKYCSAFGSDPEEAVREVLRAKKAWLQAAKQDGRPIPRPKYRPAIYRAT